LHGSERHFVLFQHTVPGTPAFQQKLNDFSNRTGAAWGSRDGIRDTLDFASRIGGCKRQPDPAHDDHIGQVVSYISDFFTPDLCIRHDLLVNRDLLDVPLEDIGHFDLPGTFGCGWRFAAADHSRFYVVPAQPSQRDAVLRIEALRLHHVPFAVGYQEQTPVRQNTIDIHEQKLDTRGRGLELFFPKRRVHLHEESERRPRTTISVLTDALLSRVTEIITRYNMASPGDHVGVGVSGGADSVVLLHLLRSLSERFQIKLTILHLNHQLRGSESDADEEFVRSMAASLDLPSVVERGEIATDGNLEQAARLARREFYRRAMHQRSLRRVALGHTRSDQAETVLFRFLRGSGTAGLTGMRMITPDGLIRPLLTTARDEVRRWAIAHCIPWREDSSNTNLAFSRNRIREQVIPALARDFNSNLEAGLAQTAELAQDEEDYWVDEIEPIFQQTVRQTHFGLILDVAQFAALRVAVQRRVVRRAIGEVRGDLRSIDSKHIDAILGLVGSSSGHDRVIVPGVDALRSFDKLRLTNQGAVKFEDRHYRLALEIGEECELPFQAGRIALNAEARPEAPICASFKEECGLSGEVAELDGDALADGGMPRPLYVRNWEPGDALQFPGRTGVEKIKTLFQEHRVLLWERRHWPVVVCGNEIVWARRFGSAAKFKISAGSRNVIRLVYGSHQAERSPT
jgi:tRNA(Ile)-lysidine synthase